MDLPGSWAPLLADRGIDPAGAVFTRFQDGESTDVWRIDVPAVTGTGAGRAAATYVARRYPAGPTEELDVELAASVVLAGAGFPTPAPLPSGSGALRSMVGGAPATLWSFIPGHHAASLADGYGSTDQALGRRAAGLLATMHGNLLLDDEGGIVALLDFGDCMQSLLIYELASVDLLVLHAGAETIDVVGGWIAEGIDDVRLEDSFSARQFTDLVAARGRLQIDGSPNRSP